MDIWVMIYVTGVVQVFDVTDVTAVWVGWCLCFLFCYYEYGPSAASLRWYSWHLLLVKCCLLGQFWERTCPVLILAVRSLMSERGQCLCKSQAFDSSCLCPGLLVTVGQAADCLVSWSQSSSLGWLMDSVTKHIITKCVTTKTYNGKMSKGQNVHCKPSPFGKQFCMANTAIFTSYITFQSNQKKIFHPKQMWIYEIFICTFRQD